MVLWRALVLSGSFGTLRSLDNNNTVCTMCTGRRTWVAAAVLLLLLLRLMALSLRLPPLRSQARVVLVLVLGEYTSAAKQSGRGPARCGTR